MVTHLTIDDMGDPPTNHVQEFVCRIENIEVELYNITHRLDHMETLLEYIFEAVGGSTSRLEPVAEWAHSCPEQPSQE
jgi:hypothetical protein